MAERVTGLFKLGQTYGEAAVAGGGNSILGMEAEFDDIDPASGGSRTKGCRKKLCRLVRNTSGGALTPGELATIDYATNGLPGLEVGGAGAALDHHVGVVDEWLPAAGVADDDIFWLTIKGPTKVLCVTGTTIAAGDDLVPGASGGAETIDGAPATDPAAQNNALSRFGVALEGVTTASAGDKILADVDCHV